MKSRLLGLSLIWNYDNNLIDYFRVFSTPLFMTFAKQEIKVSIVHGIRIYNIAEKVL